MAHPSITTTTSIPSEILSSIVEELHNNRSSLYSICLCSRSFYSEAARVLYRTVIDLDSVSQVAFLETILGSPTLASYLRVYSIPSYAFPARTQILALFFRGIQNDVFRNLQCLSWNQSLHTHGTLLKFPSLVSLRYETIADCDELLPFLSNLQALKHLAIDSFCLTKGIETVRPLITSCCPNITTFYTTVFSSTAAFLPGRRIDTLIFDERSEHATNFSDPNQVGHYAARFKTGNMVGDAFSRLQRISLRFASWHPLFLDVLLGAVGDVEVLEMIFAGSIVTTSVERNMVEGLEQGIVSSLVFLETESEHLAESSWFLRLRISATSHDCTL